VGATSSPLLRNVQPWYSQRKNAELPLAAWHTVAARCVQRFISTWMPPVPSRVTITGWRPITVVL
jgi:hypothetical protein